MNQSNSKMFTTNKSHLCYDLKKKQKRGKQLLNYRSGKNYRPISKVLGLPHLTVRAKWKTTGTIRAFLDMVSLGKCLQRLRNNLFRKSQKIQSAKEFQFMSWEKGENMGKMEFVWDKQQNNIPQAKTSLHLRSTDFWKKKNILRWPSLYAWCALQKYSLPWPFQHFVVL